MLCQPPDAGKKAGAMVTYSDLFTFVIMLCAVITLVLAISGGQMCADQRFSCSFPEIVKSTACAPAPKNKY